MSDNLNVIFHTYWGQIPLLVRAGPSDKLVVKEILLDNVYRLTKDHLKGGAVVDLGANIGVFSMLVAKMNKTERVIAFEPEEEQYWLLMQNIAANEVNGQVVPIQQAVAATTGRRRLAVDRGRSAFEELRDPSDKLPRVPCDCVSLEDAYNRNGIGTCDFLKIDVEGAEHEIITAAPKDIMKRTSFIAIETHKMEQRLFGELLAKLTETHKLTTLGGSGGGGYIWGEMY